MKHGFLGFLGFLVLTSSAFALTPPREEAIELTKAYLVVGFDTNDRVEVTVEGELPGSCYRVGTAKYFVDEKTRTITVEQFAYKYANVCLNIPRPFPSHVSVGILETSGPYHVIDKTSGRDLGVLPIREATTEAPDDFDYAAITDAFVTSDESHSNTLVLEATLPDRCTEMNTPTINYTKGAIIVQPVVSKNMTSGDCKPNPRKATKRTALSGGLRGKVLLHVRSSEGKAVNKLVNLD